MDDDPLSRFGLRPVELVDQAVINPFFASLAEPLSDYTFSQLFTWRNSLRILWTTLHNHLCVFANGSGDLTLLMPPIGDGGSDRALTAAFEIMDEYNATHGVPDRSRVEYVSDELLGRLNKQGLDTQPMGADYVYDSQRMIDLAGGDLASKRQAKNRFMRNYQYRVEAFDASRHMESCRRLLETWKIHQDATHLEEANCNSIKRQKESIATNLTLEYAGRLGMKGMVIYVRSAAENDWEKDADGFALRAFTFGEYLGREQSSITIEKTDLEVKGLAQFIFSEFCRQNWSDRSLVNVGDDWGLETLAWTKMSYRPVKMLQKSTVSRPKTARIAVPATISMGDNIQPVIQVRQAGKNDLNVAVELERICFSSHNLRKRQLQYLQQRSSALFLVAEQNDIVVGQGISLVRQHKRALSGRIYSLAVHPDCRGKGIGVALLDAMIRQLVERGVKRVYLEVDETNTGAIRLYERNGFRHIGVLPDYYAKGRPALHMMREIIAEGLFQGDYSAAAQTAVTVK